MKKISRIISLIGIITSLQCTLSLSECKNHDRHHQDPNVIRCPYTQQDIDRACKRLPHRYCNSTCFYCGCSRETHTK